MLLASAFVSYAGPFTSRFRAGLVADWIKYLGDKKVPMTAGIKGACFGLVCVRACVYACMRVCVCAYVRVLWGTHGCASRGGKWGLAS